MLLRRFFNQLPTQCNFLKGKVKPACSVFLIVSVLWPLGPASAGSSDFSGCWRFHLGVASGAHSKDYDDSAWHTVRLPHTARIESLVTGAAGDDSLQWQGICWYRKKFEINEDTTGKVVWLKLDAAMGEADVWLNEQLLCRHSGGYLPIVLDISDVVKSDTPNVLAVRLNNYDNGITGPKPLSHLDFNFYGGLYRSANLIIKNKLHERRIFVRLSRSPLRFQRRCNICERNDTTLRS